MDKKQVSVVLMDIFLANTEIKQSFTRYMWRIKILYEIDNLYSIILLTAAYLNIRFDNIVMNFLVLDGSNFFLSIYRYVFIYILG